MTLWNAVKPLWQAIKTSPATTPAVLMAWGIPTLCVPLFRFLDDGKRPFHDRLMLSLRDLSAYAVGWGIFLVVTPSIQYGLDKAAQQMTKPLSKHHVGLISTAIGCVLAAAYSGFGAKRLAQRITQQWVSSSSASSWQSSDVAVVFQTMRQRSPQGIEVTTSQTRVLNYPPPFRPLFSQRY